MSSQTNSKNEVDLIVSRLTKKQINKSKRINEILDKKINKSARSKFNYNQGINSFIEELKKVIASKALKPETKVYKPYITINEDFNSIDKIHGLKTMLFKHQQTAVAAMLDIENARIIDIEDVSTSSKSTNSGVINKISNMAKSAVDSTIKTVSKYMHLGDQDPTCFEYSYNSAVLSEPVGSGKTIDILSIIIINKIPRALPDINVIGDLVIKTKYTKLIKATLIFVSSSVLDQWEMSIKKFTYLSHFTIRSVIELRVLFELITSKDVNKYDIILIKNGVISVPMDFPSDIKVFHKNTKKPISIYNVISNLYNHCWARVVYDDFDNIKIPENSSKINALFTWYVSSTRDETLKYNNNPKIKTSNLTDKLLEMQNYYNYIIYDKLGFQLMNVRNDQEFINAHNKMPFIKFHVVAFVSTNDNVINMIGAMGNGDLTEMLNGEAVGEAAARIGINATSVIDIFEKILGDNYSNYIMASKIMAFIEYQEENEDERLPMSDNPDLEDRYYGIERLNNFEDIKYKYPNVSNILREAYLKYENIKAQAGLSIQRVKDNIKHGECPICVRSLSTVDDYIIVKCCNNILCRQCGISSQVVGGKISRCSNCRAQLTVKDLIFVGESLDLDKIVNEEFDDSEPADDSSASSASLDEEINDKFEAIIAIIKRKKIKNDVRVELNLPNVIKGSCYMKEASIRKVLIFANYKESLTKMSDKLNKNKIKFWTLGGTAKEIFELSNNFTNCETECALLIKATEYCSGLNLQTATDLVFLHRLENVELECQVIGRGQRMGRQSPLNIWYMLFENELNRLVDSHGVRKLTTEDIDDENNEKLRAPLPEDFGSSSASSISPSTPAQIRAKIRASGVSSMSPNVAARIRQTRRNSRGEIVVTYQDEGEENHPEEEFEEAEEDEEEVEVVEEVEEYDDYNDGYGYEEDYQD